MSSNSPISEATIKKLAKILNEADLTEIEYEVGEARIRVAKEPPAVHSNVVQGAAPMAVAPMAAPSPAPAAAEAAPASEASLESHPGLMRAPMVGTVYHASSPDADPFAQEGEEVKEGQTLLIIEAMKVMNPIKANKAGKLKKILVDNAQPVEYDQPLVVIE